MTNPPIIIWTLVHARDSEAGPALGEIFAGALPVVPPRSPSIGTFETARIRLLILAMVRTKQTAKKSTGGTAPRVSLTNTSNTGNLTLAPCRNDPAIPALDPCNSPLSTHAPCGATQAASPMRPEDPRPCLAALLSSSFGQPEAESPCNGNTENNDVGPFQLIVLVRYTLIFWQFCHLCMDGGTLWRCDFCIRSECKKCVVVPPEFLTVVEHAGVKYLCLSCHLMDDVKSKTVIPYMVVVSAFRPSVHLTPHFSGLLSRRDSRASTTTPCTWSVRIIHKIVHTSPSNRCSALSPQDHTPTRSHWDVA